MSAFLLAIEQIYEEREEIIKGIAIANRVAQFADNDGFQEFIKAKEEVNLDEYDKFSL